MTSITEIYEQLRVLLSPEGFVTLPVHELTDKLLTNLYTEEEARLITTCFPGFREVVSFEEIKKTSGIPEDKLTDMLWQMVIRGKIHREGEDKYFMVAYLPGVFEDYFTVNTDDPQIMKKVAEAHRALQKMNFNPDIEWPLKATPDFNPESGW